MIKLSNKREILSHKIKWAWKDNQIKLSNENIIKSNNRKVHLIKYNKYVWNHKLKYKIKLTLNHLMKYLDSYIKYEKTLHYTMRLLILRIEHLILRFLYSYDKVYYYKIMTKVISISKGGKW